MKIFTNKKKVKSQISGIKNMAFIPTMGGLHKGHKSLILKAKKKSNKIIVSIFVNPKQFNSLNDFKKYPKNISRDIKILKKMKIDYLYMPNYKDIYSFKTQKKIYLSKYSKILCGKKRPGHFKGVINVVNRFIEIINPKYIYLGKKDYQQLIVIKNHIIQNHIKTKVVSCPTIREINGVAMSSRNKNLNKIQLNIASKIFKYLKRNKKNILKLYIMRKKSNVVNKILSLGATSIDYIQCIDLKTFKNTKSNKKRFNIFISYYLGNVRLIDNL